MDPTELIKAAPEIAKGAGALAAAVPFTAIVKRMLGPAADELAEMWRDQVRLYRYERQVKCVQKAEKMAEDAGFTPQAVPPKILFPLLEGASFEDDESLHDMWAALLANAASPENAEMVRPGFIAILKQMCPDEALLLNWIATYKGPPQSVTTPEGLPDLTLFHFMINSSTTPLPWRQDPEKGYNEFFICLDALLSLQLVSKRSWKEGEKQEFSQWNPPDDRYFGIPGPPDPVEHTITITERGCAFFEACRPPKPKENG